MSTQYDVIVIGAGQAGLTTGYYLRQTKLSFLLLDQASALGQSWKQRYDSLRLFSPNAFNALPGLAFPGRPDEYPSKDQVAVYLQSYAKRFALPIQLQAQVRTLQKQADHFVIDTTQGTYEAKNVIVATGPFQKPYVPPFAASLSARVFKIHTANYRTPRQIPKGSVLVVGLGNSGAQIAVELAPTHPVTVASRTQPRFIRQIILGKSWMVWLKRLGLLRASVSHWPGSALARRPEPIIGTELRDLLKNKKVHLKPAVVGVSGDALLFADQTKEHFTSIIWATGFVPNYSWIKIPGLDPDKLPVHRTGSSTIPGLYFVGLKFQATVSSGLLSGVGRDARAIVQRLVRYT